MKKMIFIIVLILLLNSCSSEYEINTDNIEGTYRIDDRSLNLDNKNITVFLNLNKYMSWTEVNNIYLQNNKIQRLDISEFSKLWRLDISNNDIRFINDLKLPKKIRHLNVSGNSLDDIDWLDNYLEMKTLDLSNNNLDDNDINFSKFKKLRYINIEWNKVSTGVINKINDFNSVYLSQNKKPFSK